MPSGLESRVECARWQKTFRGQNVDAITTTARHTADRGTCGTLHTGPILVRVWCRGKSCAETQWNPYIAGDKLKVQGVGEASIASSLSSSSHCSAADERCGKRTRLTALGIKIVATRWSPLLTLRGWGSPYRQFGATCMSQLTSSGDFALW